MAIGNKCNIEGCINLVTVKRCAMCTMHRQRRYKYKSIHLPVRKLKEGIIKICPKHGELTANDVVQTHVKRKRAADCPGFPFRDAYCKQCHYKRMQKGRLKAQYGITLDEYREMFRKQNGKCEICKTNEPIKTKSGRTRKLAVDHCHKTGKNRDLLCAHCNTGLGMFKESQRILNNAQLYLKRHGVTD